MSHFRDKQITLPRGWETELSDAPLEAPRSEGEQLGTRWEAVRHRFIGSGTPVGDFAWQAKTKWPQARWQHPVSDYARLTWQQLQAKRSFPLSKQRALVETLEWAHAHGRT